MSERALLCLHALTGLHLGSGAAQGVIDLPVQRERHTQWPLVPASSLKGVLRSALHGQPGIDVSVVPAMFGADTADDAHGGAVALTDARILAFPVRSLSGVFAWVTCPGVITRLARDLSLVGLPVPDPLAQEPQQGTALCDGASPLVVQDDRIMLEEFEFTRTGPCDGLATWIADNAIADAATGARLRKHLAVLHDDDFTHFVRFATEVTARIGLDYETRAVRPGALFYEEVVPPETLLYSLVLSSASMKPGDERHAGDMLALFAEHLPPILQVGADASIGRGLCATRLVQAGGGGQ
jgi:CRISPR-associated protein Cmr4